MARLLVTALLSAGLGLVVAGTGAEARAQERAGEGAGEGTSEAGVSTAAEAGQSPLDLKELARVATDSVVLLRILGPTGREVGNGTGFFIDAGLVVTNAHVVEPATRVEAVLADGSTLDVAGVVARDVHADLAVLLLAPVAGPTPGSGVVAPGPPGAGDGLPLAADGGVEPGMDVVVLGNPLGLSGTLSTGIVSAVRPEGIDPDSPEPGHRSPRIQITAAISPGSSGSPVMGFDGQVIGVAVSQLLYGQNLNFAVPVSELRRVLAKAQPGILAQTYSARGAVSFSVLRNLLLSSLVFAALVLFLRRTR